jgi:GT2 family glycosyltransferase
MPEPSVLTPASAPSSTPAASPALGLKQPVSVEIPAALRAPAPRITAVVPCYNRPDDARNLLSDLARLTLPHIDLQVLLVDNASDSPLSTLETPEGLRLEHLRLSANTGGSGGFNAGIAHALAASAGPPDYIWLIDSDARVEPSALEALVGAMAANPGLIVAGSALGDPATGEVFELGGHIDRLSGLLIQPTPTPADLARDIIPVQYVAACSMLVRASAIPDAGLMPEVFVNGDDVGWCLRLSGVSRRSAAGSGDAFPVAAIPGSRARHPHHDKMHTWGRYYIARNAFGPIDALHLGLFTRFRRAMRETLRAVLQQCMNRPDLATLHMAGLRDARAGRTTGPAPKDTIRFSHFEPLTRLAERLGPLKLSAATRVSIEPGLNLSPAIAGTLKEQLQAASLAAAVEAPQGTRSGTFSDILSAAARLLIPANDVAIVSARGRPRSWFRGKTQIQLVNEGKGSFIIRPTAPIASAARAFTTVLKGLGLSLRLAASPVAPATVPPAPTRQPRAPSSQHTPPSPSLAPSTERRALSATVIVLSYNRFPALERTLSQLSSFSSLAHTDIFVVDNGSTDGTLEKLNARFPNIRVLALKDNIGVAAFNRAAEQATSDLLLILDDDAVAEEAALVNAIELLAHRPDLVAVTFHPRHPATNQSEWRFASLVDPTRGHDRWPVMGCANLVRREAWLRAGGYEESFFLYRNDTDLALKLLAHGEKSGSGGVHFNPTWIAWHDSPAAAKKSPRWHHLATRNWVWLARRHARGLSLPLGITLGYLWSHKLAGLSPKRHLATIKGLLEGLTKRPAPAPPTSGNPWRSLIRLHLGKSEK